MTHPERRFCGPANLLEEFMKPSWNRLRPFGKSGRHFLLVCKFSSFSDALSVDGSCSERFSHIVAADRRRLLSIARRSSDLCKREPQANAVPRGFCRKAERRQRMTRSREELARVVCAPLSGGSSIRMLRIPIQVEAKAGMTAATLWARDWRDDCNPTSDRSQEGSHCGAQGLRHG
jgi:hypothetical protein